MKQFIGALIGLMFLAPASLAQENIGCNKAQVTVLEDTLRNAKELTLKAASAVGDTAEYERWFGTYSQSNAEVVRRSLKSIVGAIRSGAVTAQCHTVQDDGCQNREYAWVYVNEPLLLHFCPSFFTLPPLEALDPGSPRSENGTREGTIVHELSHFSRVAGTDDHCYSRSECSGMARYDERRAIDNADSYQYFTEDVTYYARQPVAGKPAVND